ncbi:hypothetical protein TD95_001624 [Thielaviopsis punctulata]|uniref:Mitochondrial escape protein 2 n=1 Tax=Thielaviopsis punctulata TaxID=72032 RepID=A0A0F4Z848_9PEZI|nr:hypothetical protein TD95_001624 [Thielaviopsis punctulata]
MMLLRRAQLRAAALQNSRLLLSRPQTLAVSRGWRPMAKAHSTLVTPPTDTMQPVEDTDVAEDRQGGHISAKQNEALFFVSNTFFLPVRFAFMLEWFSPSESDAVRRLANPSQGSDPISLARQAIGTHEGVEIIEVIPRLKDGGAFVKVRYQPGTDPKQLAETIKTNLKEKPVRTWYSPIHGIDVGLVKGVPWLEDLRRFPGRRVKVEFTPKDTDGAAAELSQENMYSLFRRYGKISELTSQPFDSKILPRYAYVDFARMSDAIMARNCLHGVIVPAELGGGKSGTRLRTSYETNVRMRNIWTWLTSHPRIVIPLLAALLAAVTVSVFDPIRKFFVQTHIQHPFDLNKNAIYTWFKSRTSDLLSFAGGSHDSAAFSAVWEHQQGLVDDVKSWTRENTDTFVVVHGPRGSGKGELVLNQALSDRKNILVIDCKPIADARGERVALKNLAASVGYRPIFAWAYSVASLIDLAIQGTTGVKSSFSETFEAQISRILHTTAVALKDASVHDRQKLKDADLSEDAFLEAHPERRSVVVVENFLHGFDENQVLYEKLTEWAAMLVQNHAAHVIFLTSDASYSKSLSRVLPDRAFHQVSLGELAPDVARNFVLSRLSADSDDAQTTGSETEAAERRHQLEKLDYAQLDRAIHTLGGRVTDLESLARRLSAGAQPDQALNDMVAQQAADIVRMYLTPRADASSKAWTPSQAWVLVSKLAHHNSLRYEEIMLSGLFASDPVSSAAAIDALAAAELISVRWQAGRPRSIGAGKPAFRAAFEALVNDAVVCARLELDALLELIKVETKKIDKAEAELVMLGSLPKQPWQVGGRVKYLLDKLDMSQQKVNEYEQKVVQMKKLLTSRS